MSEEKELKGEGEALAKIAVESRMGRKQLNSLYKIAQTKPMEFLDAFVKRQLSRTLDGTMGGGEAFAYIAELLKKYEGRRFELQRVLMYALMLYDYYEKEPLMKIRPVAEAAIKREVQLQGYAYGSTEIQVDRNAVVFNVRVPGFSGNPKTLASEIESALRNKQELSGMNVRVWISR